MPEPMLIGGKDNTIIELPDNGKIRETLRAALAERLTKEQAYKELQKEKQFQRTAPFRLLVEPEAVQHNCNLLHSFRL